MPSIKPSSIRELKDRINIYDVVAREVTLKKAGSSYKGLSPFNNEKSPSFYVSPDKGFYKCFSSGNAGDAISFVMETERLTFAEAVETLAKRFSFELEYEQGSSRAKEERSLRQELFDLHELATDFYHECFLADGKAGEWIRNYWTKNRSFDLSVAEDFKIGLAPIDSTELGRRAIKKGFSKEAIEASGLFYAKRSLDPAVMGYRFRGRLMIPIRDHQGRVTAFTARQLEITPQDDPAREAKYVNSPETPIFHKSNLLFNLDRARLKVNEDTPFVMVEGQLDAIRCFSVGIETAVAPQGTGITESQLRLLKRYEPQLIVLLDGDAAGQKAALRMLPLTLAQGIEATFIPLTDKEDPDDIFRDGGSAALDTLLERKLQPIPFAAQAIAPDCEKLTPQAKAKAARELFAIIDKAESSAAQIEFAKQAAACLQLDERATLSDYSRYAAGRPVATQRPASPPPASAAPKPASKNATTEENPGPEPEPHPDEMGDPLPRRYSGPVRNVERDLAALCMVEPETAQALADVVELEWINTARPEGVLLTFILNEFLHDTWNGPESLSDHLESVEQKKLASDIYFDAEKPENPERLCNEALKKLVSNFVERKTKELKLEIGRKQATNDADVLSLLGELTALSQLRRKPPQVGSSFS